MRYRGPVLAFILALLATQTAALIAVQGDAVAKSRTKRAKKKPKPTPASSSRADGRERLKKANALAAKGACELAIEEYTLAFDRLNDPDILLLRAECRRKVGQGTDAVADYKAYLEVTPDVRNRADIEAKIATLTAALESGTSKTPPPDKPPPPVVETKPPPPPPVAERKPPPPPPPPLPPVTIEPPPPSPVVAEPVVPNTPPLVTSEPEPTRPPAPDPEAKPAESKGHFWIWTIVAVVVAGGAAVAGYWYLRPVDQPPPATQLGNYRF